MKAVILSGGKGTRLRPLTDTIPKPMLPIGGKPHLEHIVELLTDNGVDHIIFSTGYLHEQIPEYFGDGSRYGIKFDYVEDGDIPLGTAGAIKNCEEKLDLEPSESFIVFNGDILTDLDVFFMYFGHIIDSQPNKITISLTPVENPSQFGVAVLDGRNIIEFVEKPTNPDYGNLINAGVYILDKEVLDFIPKKKFCMIETEVFPFYAKHGNLYMHTEQMYWLDIGTHERYNQANEDFEKKIKKN